MQEKNSSKYPLLEESLGLRGLAMKAMFSNGDAAKLFAVSVRTIQNHVASGVLASRRLMGSARFLPCDLEAFLQGSLKKTADELRAPSHSCAISRPHS
jgi:hypothetical protein